MSTRHHYNNGTVEIVCSPTDIRLSVGEWVRGKIRRPRHPNMESKHYDYNPKRFTVEYIKDVCAKLSTIIQIPYIIIYPLQLP